MPECVESATWVSPSPVGDVGQPRKHCDDTLSPQGFEHRRSGVGTERNEALVDPGVSLIRGQLPGREDSQFSGIEPLFGGIRDRGSSPFRCWLNQRKTGTWRFWVSLCGPDQ